MNHLFTGVGVALVTPFTEDGIDFELFERMIERQIAAGVSALIVLGTTGEPCTMTEAERAEVLRFAVRVARGRLPVIAGAGDNDTRRAVARAVEAEALGASSLLVVTPYYNKATQDGLCLHYEAIADAVRVPLILYNVPGRTGVNLLPETVARLCAHPRIRGLKEAGPVLQLGEAVRRAQGHLRVYSGEDAGILPALALGASGAISVTANVAPEIVCRMVACWFRGETQRALALHQSLCELNALLFCEVNPIPVKAALSMMGFGDGRLRLPLTNITEKNRLSLRKALRDMDLI